jgi:hypothetical protein
VFWWTSSFKKAFHDFNDVQYPKVISRHNSLIQVTGSANLRIDARKY